MHCGRDLLLFRLPSIMSSWQNFSTENLERICSFQIQVPTYIRNWVLLLAAGLL